VDPLLALAMLLVLALVIAADPDETGTASAGSYLSAVAFGALALAGRRLPRTTLDFPVIGIALPAVAGLDRATERAPEAEQRMQATSRPYARTSTHVTEELHAPRAVPTKGTEAAPIPP
jgi:hypothetical protein